MADDLQFALPGVTVTRLLFLVLAMAGFASAAVVTEPDPVAIVRKSIEVMQADWKLAPEYSYVERELQSKREAAPTVKSYEVLLIEGSPYRRLIAVDDKSLEPGDQAEEDRKMQAEIERRQHESDKEQKKRTAKYLRERKREHDMVREMADAFIFSLAGEESVDGHDCWILDTRPNPNYDPKDREARVLMGMAGRLWIDKDSSQWVKAKAEVVRPVSFYGFLAKVGPGTRFVLEQEPISPNVWLPKRFSMQVNASALGFLNEDSREEDSYRDYKPMAQSLSLLQAHK